MKKLFMLMLCFFLVAASAQAGGGATSAEQGNPRQAGKSNIIFYDVEATENHGYGRLVINTNKNTFTFIGQDFTPNKWIELQQKTEGGPFVAIAVEKSTPSGNLHMSGTWVSGVLPTLVRGYYYPAICGFEMENDAWVVARMTVHWTEDHESTNPVWIQSSVESEKITIGQRKRINLEDYGVPHGAKVRLKAIVLAGQDALSYDTFTYDCGYLYNFCYADFTLDGATFDNMLINWDPLICSNQP